MFLKLSVVVSCGVHGGRQAPDFSAEGSYNPEDPDCHCLQSSSGPGRRFQRNVACDHHTDATQSNNRGEHPPTGVPCVGMAEHGDRQLKVEREPLVPLGLLNLGLVDLRGRGFPA